MALLIRYHLRTGDTVEHHTEGAVQEAVEFHEQIFKLGDDARLTVDTDGGGACIIRFSAVDRVDIEADGGGGLPPATP